MNKRFYRFTYAAIRRYGENRWTAESGTIEVNPNYVVSISQDEKHIFCDGHNYPFIVELSNGSKFLMFLHEYGEMAGDEILSEQGEIANSAVGDGVLVEAKRNIGKYNYKPYYNHD